MRQQEALWADVAIVENYAAALDVDEFGGMWWNNDRDPVAFVLAVTNRSADHRCAAATGRASGTSRGGRGQV
jgi:hypothetical protein